jgi:hypothetical protein
MARVHGFTVNEGSSKLLCRDHTSKFDAKEESVASFSRSIARARSNNFQVIQAAMERSQKQLIIL